MGESDGRGRHTTTRRELVVLPQGWLLMDTPGLRELQLWATGESLDQAFRDIEDLAAQCRFRDCAHDTEPGCAVRGVIDKERMVSYRKLRREIARLETRQDARAALERKAEVKRLHRMIRRLPHK